jgi:hypothetical protein
MPDTSTGSFATLADAQTAVQSHPLCQSFLVTPTQYAVFYPDAYRVPGGVAVKRGNDDLAAMTLMYQRLENFWNSQRLQIAKT